MERIDVGRSKGPGREEEAGIGERRDKTSDHKKERRRTAKEGHGTTDEQEESRKKTGIPWNGRGKNPELPGEKGVTRRPSHVHRGTWLSQWRSWKHTRKASKNIWLDIKITQFVSLSQCNVYVYTSKILHKSSKDR
ncbi:hypothetical protein NDU88_005219 [Pleurodeles waltl]|uniref:Uncharacterized protein n=1 Tax=Pleurodeles waltl TaxID=8319 RepID=A0AAV7L028_PLEWA|nr:hypothetical protein NDU88_005219 [Pleurodeles waltl]